MMKRWIFGTALVAIAAGPALSAQAQTSFKIRKIAVNGSYNVDAVSINHNGVIAATVYDAGGTQSGVVIDGPNVTTLPVPYAGADAPMPQSINARGDVLGYAYEGFQPHMFLWYRGPYDPNADVALEIEQQPGPPPLPIALNNKGKVVYTIITGMQNPTDPIYGRLPNVRSMPYLMRYQTAHSINAAGMIAGTTFYSASSEVFVGIGKNFSTLLPPNAKTANGGYVNNSGEVAGAYIDTSGTQHGFTWLAGKYTSFDLPEAAQPYSLAVTGLSNDGRVVGVYASNATGQQHAFLYNGKTVTPFGDYRGPDVITVTLNDRGEILLARQIKQQTANYLSYRIRCTGTGC